MEIQLPMPDSSLFHKNSFDYEPMNLLYSSPPYGLGDVRPHQIASSQIADDVIEYFSYHNNANDLINSAFDSCSSDNVSNVTCTNCFADIPNRNLDAQVACAPSPADSLTEELECLAYHSQPMTPTELGTAIKNTDPIPQIHRSYLDKTYDTSSIMYDNDEISMLSELVNCDEVLQNSKLQRKSSCTSLSSPMQLVQSPNAAKKMISDESQVLQTSNFGQPACEDKIEIPKLLCNEDSKKGKIGCLQRSALDAIFRVTDRPSRGLVLHIGSELGLHHITVKNFFSNGRRRLRRAAARLNDPERTRRENQRRKEKRRLAALAAASAISKEKNITSASKNSSLDIRSSQFQRDPPVLSPQRRALMEKLVVKVQRSTAQKTLGYNGKSTENLSIEKHSMVEYSPRFQRVRNENLPEEHSKVVDPFRSSTLQPDELCLETSLSGPIAHFLNEKNIYTNQHYLAVETGVTSGVTQCSSLYGNDDQGPFSPTSWQTLLHE